MSAYIRAFSKLCPPSIVRRHPPVTLSIPTRLPGSACTTTSPNTVAPPAKNRWTGSREANKNCADKNHAGQPVSPHSRVGCSARLRFETGGCRNLAGRSHQFQRFPPLMMPSNQNSILHSCYSALPIQRVGGFTNFLATVVRLPQMTRPNAVAVTKSARSSRCHRGSASRVPQR